MVQIRKSIKLKYREDRIKSSPNLPNNSGHLTENTDQTNKNIQPVTE